MLFQGLRHHIVDDLGSANRQCTDGQKNDCLCVRQ